LTCCSTSLHISRVLLAIFIYVLAEVIKCYMLAGHQMMGHAGFGMPDTPNNLHEYIHQSPQMLPLVSSLKHVYCINNTCFWIIQSTWCWCQGRALMHLQALFKSSQQITKSYVVRSMLMELCLSLAAQTPLLGCVFLVTFCCQLLI